MFFSQKKKWGIEQNHHINFELSVSSYKPVSVPRDDVAIEARRDEEPSVGVVLDVLHPAGVAVQRANL